MNSFPTDFRALVIGASGAIGAAFVHALSANAQCGSGLAGRAPFHLIINAVGVLHSPHFMPEKKLGDLHYAQITVRSCRGNA